MYAARKMAMIKCDELRMFKYASMIKSLAFCAATFACLSVVFKNSFVIVPEVTEIRLCNIVACCYGIWFGPAGAWGCAIGNLVGDLGGSLTVLSIGGFVANFVSAYLPYKVWGILGSAYGEHRLERPSLQSTRWVVRYLLAAFVSVLACCGVLAITFEAADALPTMNTLMLVFCNNMAAALIGMLLFIMMTKIPSGMLPYWRDQMFDEKNMEYVREDMVKIKIITVASVALVIFTVGYIVTGRASLFNLDDYNQSLPMIISYAYTIAVLAISAMCQWRDRK